jgi:NADH-quinone oxidoreductase subunit L
MWVATLAISGIFPLSGFFSKDEILASTFAQAGGSRLSEASLLGIPGSAVLYGAYALLLGSALITALYMTRMMLYTFHGPNRSGEAERRYLHEAPSVMTVPLVVLAVLAFVGGWLNLPHLFAWMGPEASLHHWLEPVVGPAAAALSLGRGELSHTAEYGLIGAATLAALLGIGVAVLRLKPARLSSKAEAPAEEPTAVERVLANKYYVDELYDAAIIQPTLSVSRKVLHSGLDVGIIDRTFVVGIGGKLPRLIASIGSGLQSGRVGGYAWVLLVGVVLVLGAFTLR